jgi:hypothetical protein
VGPSTVLHQESFHRKLKIEAQSRRHHRRTGRLAHAPPGFARLEGDFLKKIFRHSPLYLGPVPTYPVGTWCYNFLSDKIDPAKVRTLYIPDGLRYFNREIYRAAFALPNFLVEALAKEMAQEDEDAYP